VVVRGVHIIGGCWDAHMRVAAAIVYTWLICGGMVVVLARDNRVHI
jgi:hypothetical protein